MSIYIAPALEQNVSWEVSANTLNLPAQGLNYGDIALNSNGDTYITLTRGYQIQTGESSMFTSDAFIAFVSEDGNIEWKRQLTNNSDDYQSAYHLLQDSNDNLYVKFYSYGRNQSPQSIIDQISSDGETLNRRYAFGDYDFTYIPERENLIIIGGGSVVDENSNISVFDQRGYEWNVQYGAQETSNGNIVFNGYANDASSDADASDLQELPDVYKGNIKFTREVSPQGDLIWSNELYTSGYSWFQLHSVGSSRVSSGSGELTDEDAANEENYLSVYTDSSGRKSISEQVINLVYLNKGNSGLTALYPEDGTQTTIFPGLYIIDDNDTHYLSSSGILIGSSGLPQFFIDRQPLDTSPFGTPLELEGQSYYDTIRVKQDDGSYLQFLRKSTLETPIHINESGDSFSINSSELSAGKKLFKLFSETIGETIYTISTAETVDLLSVDGDILKVNEYYASNENLDNTYDFTVIALEDGREAYREDYSIYFEDIDSPEPVSPADILISASSFDENITVGSVVANLSSTDEDSGDTHTYSLVSGQGSEDNGSFEIVGDELKIKESPDFDTKSSYSIRVETKDSGGLTFEKAFTLSVTDVNEDPAEEVVREWTRLLSSSSYDNATSISATADGSIYITGYTQGSLDGQTYSGSNDAFISKYSSDGTKAWTRLLGSSSYDHATSISATADGSIYITGLTEGSLDGQTNHGDSDAFVSKYSSDGTKAWTRLLGSSSSDHPTSISTAADGSIYITGATFGSLDGQTNSGSSDAFISKYNSNYSKAWTRLLGSSSYDHATSISTAADGSIYITGYTNGSLDGQTNSGDYVAFISKYSIPTINETPSDLSLSASTFTENIAAGTAVATLSNTDPDSGDSFTYALVAGTGDDDNAAFSIESNQLKIKESPDFEIKSSYSIRVQTKDSGGLTFEKAFTLNVNDLNEVPTDLLVSASTFDENISAGSVVANLSSTDEDSGDTHTYSLVSGSGDTDNSAFTIDGNQLKINTSPDYESQSTYSIRLQTKDSAGLTFEKSFTFNVNDLNEVPTPKPTPTPIPEPTPTPEPTPAPVLPPTDLSVSASTFAENIVANSIVATLSSVDPNSGDTHTYSLVSGTGDTDNSAFTIDGNQLKIKASPDYETQDSYSVRIQTTDSGGLTYEENFNLLVTNIDEVDPVTESIVFRLYNPSTGKHLFSSNDFEIDLLTGSYDWVNEGISYVSPSNGNQNLYRFFVESDGRHFYTANDFEKESIINNLPGFQYEGVAFKVFSPIDPPSGSVPVVRYLNVNGGNHVYSSSIEEQGILDESPVWKNEGIAWFGV